MEFKEIITYAAPSIAIAAMLITLLAYRLNSVSKKYENYKNDVFRQSIEKQITELSKQLSTSEDRFQSINHLLIDAQPSNKNIASESSDFLSLVGVNKEVETDKKLIFVLTPFHNEFESSYHVIKEVVEDIGLKCSRGDDATVSHNILGHIIQEMLRAKLIIANISGRNSNVFYELGIAHALGKPVLLVSETAEAIPFDLSHIRTLIYKNELDLSIGLKKWLVTSIVENA